MSSFYSTDELLSLGFKSCGSNVYISRKASFYFAEDISIGNNVRIDDFCILSGKITIGSFVHISAYSALYASHGIEIGNFCGISPRCLLFSASDDFSGEAMISPMVPARLTNLRSGKITLKDYSQLGANSIVMPAVTVWEGAVCGAFSFVNKDLPAWSISCGIPCAFLKKRSQKAKILSQLIKEENE